MTLFTASSVAVRLMRGTVPRAGACVRASALAARPAGTQQLPFQRASLARMCTVELPPLPTVDENGEPLSKNALKKLKKMREKEARKAADKAAKAAAAAAAGEGGAGGTEDDADV